ncbi:hypothetical protein SAMN05192539_102336 [Paraburkholderia diazotrophica]|uniref:Uncharacterized protein n=1 Tax=Paraburkholderia diazotrophica TaxID=667676 RepID=A0A1H7CRJ9_9BURK|nr:hypothetical protein SAMN05192539_102336 [Paraburkholderia diazotrophica]
MLAKTSSIRRQLNITLARLIASRLVSMEIPDNIACNRSAFDSNRRFNSRRNGRNASPSHGGKRSAVASRQKRSYNADLPFYWMTILQTLRMIPTRADRDVSLRPQSRAPARLLYRGSCTAPSEESSGPTSITWGECDQAESRLACAPYATSSTYAFRRVRATSSFSLRCRYLRCCRRTKANHE